jgi:hypothetical protein
VSETVDRRPPGARRRRPIPGLIFLLVLALAALFVWWNVLSDEHARDEAQAAACSSATAVPDAVDPATVTVRVYNASDQAGKAGEVRTTLESRGFVVSEAANDPTDNVVTGVGELRYGSHGKAAAAFMRLYLPGATDHPDDRATAVVDVVLGPEFAGLATQEQVDAALAPAASPPTGC